VWRNVHTRVLFVIENPLRLARRRCCHSYLFLVVPGIAFLQVVALKLQIFRNLVLLDAYLAMKRIHARMADL
jgi:hypothetical protein